MAIVWDDVVAIAPELSSTGGATQTVILAIVGRQVNAQAWGALADDGSRYLAAHLATLAARRGMGAITSEAVGPLSTSYAAPPFVFGELGATPYGLEYRRMVRLLPSALGMVP